MQQRAQRTRDSIVCSAAAVFERSGYTAATLDEIAHEAQLTKGALYFHFASKAELANAIVVAHHDRWRRLSRESTEWSLDALCVLERLIVELGDAYRTNVIARAGVRLGNEHLLVDTELPKPFVHWMAEVEALLRRGHDDGSVSPRVDPASASRWIVASFFGIQGVSFRRTERQDVGERLAEWWAFVRPALQHGPPGPPAPHAAERPVAVEQS